MLIPEPYRFDWRIRQWRKAPSTADRALSRLSLATFNVWFGDYCLRERCAALLDILRRRRPQIIALQEVTPLYLEQVLAEDWIRRDYWVSDPAGATVTPHGVLLLGRPPASALAWCELPSRKDRKLLVAELRLNGRPLYVANVHLESAPDNTPLRLEQLDTVLPGLEGAGHSIITGDFNFDPIQQAEESRIQARYRDLWEELRPGEPGYTEDTSINRMRLMHKNKEKQVRFDRILLRSPTPGWRPRAIELLGTEPISAATPDLFPSDHFGLAATLEWQTSAE
jgi:tyrosyl-DNA phosphodiesterase 2